MAGRHAAEGVAGADFGNGAFVAVHATVVADLQEKRPVSESVAAFDTLGAANAKSFVNGVLVIRILDEGSFDGGGGAQTILGTGVEIVGLGFEIARAKLAVPTNRVSMHTFDR
jgi:hypothetical protein